MTRLKKYLSKTFILWNNQIRVSVRNNHLGLIMTEYETVNNKENKIYMELVLSQAIALRDFLNEAIVEISARERIWKYLYRFTEAKNDE